MRIPARSITSGEVYLKKTKAGLFEALRPNPNT